MKYLHESTSCYIRNCDLPAVAQCGQVWYDSDSQSIKTYDGQNWVTISQPKFIMMPDAEEAIDYVIKHIQKQTELTELAAKYPLVNEALGQLQFALKLCQNVENDG